MPVPPSFEILPVALGLLSVLTLLRWRRGSGPSASSRARHEEVRAYRALVGDAARLLEAGRLTDAKVVIDDRLWQMRTEAASDERSRYIPSETRRLVWERDGGCCVRCAASEDLQFDHIVAWSRGGGHSPENIELLCGRCNRAKAARIE